MIYKMHIPPFPLSQFITHFNYYKGHCAVHSIDRFLPNGNIEIVIDLTHTPKYIYDNHTLLEKQACKKIWISGIRNSFISIPSARDSEMFVINFRKGMVRPFLNMPLCEITDRVIDGDLILDGVFLELRETLMNAASVSEMFLLTEKLLMQTYGNTLTVNP
jgi:hypothetical protein